MKDEKDLEIVEKPKKKKGVIIGFILLILIILGLVGYILYDKGIIKLDAKKEKVETNEEVKKEKEETPEELSIDDKLVTENMKKIGGFSENYYDKEKTTIEDLDNNVLLSAGIYLYAQDSIVPSINYDDENLEIEAIKGTINKEKLGKNIKSIFGSKIKYNDTLTEKQYVKIDKGIIMEVNSNYSYKLRGMDNEWGDLVSNIYTKNEKALQYSDRIEIYQKSLILSQTRGEDFVYVYKATDQGLKSSIGKESAAIKWEDIANKYYNKADTYKFIFKLEDGNYIFSSVELVK